MTCGGVIKCKYCLISFNQSHSLIKELSCITCNIAMILLYVKSLTLSGAALWSHHFTIQFLVHSHLLCNVGPAVVRSFVSALHYYLYLTDNRPTFFWPNLLCCTIRAVMKPAAVLTTGNSNWTLCPAASCEKLTTGIQTTIFLFTLPSLFATRQSLTYFLVVLI